MPTAYIALGSNLQNPIRQVQSALLAVANIPSTHLIKQSSLYQTAPIDCVHTEQQPVPDFINAVALLETDLTPIALLEALFDIENIAGRERPYVNAPRVLDCDLLLYENMSINTNKLTLPHPRMHHHHAAPPRESRFGKFRIFSINRSRPPFVNFHSFNNSIRNIVQCLV